MRRSILFVINGLGTGGSERSMAELLPWLQRAGIHIEVVCFYRRPEGVHEQVVRQGIPVHNLTDRGLWGRVTGIRRRIREGRFGLLHTVHFEADLAGRLAAVGTGAKVMSSFVSTTYDPARWSDPSVNPWKLRLVRGIDGWTARHLSHHFHAVSQAARDSNVRALRLDPDRVTVVHRGRDPERLGVRNPERRLRILDALELEPDSRILLHVGRQEYAKGLPVLLQAVAPVLRSDPRRVLLQAGREGHETPGLQRLFRQLGLGSRCRMLGHREDVPDLLAAADVFVFPSLYEGLPGALIEALAVGLPVVASDLPSVREVVEHGANARLVPPGRPGPLTSALETLLQDRELAAGYGRTSRRIFLDRFTLERSATSMLALYDRLLPGQPDPTSEPRSGVTS